MCAYLKAWGFGRRICSDLFFGKCHQQFLMGRQGEEEEEAA